jgi:hypothetical protein
VIACVMCACLTETTFGRLGTRFDETRPRPRRNISSGIFRWHDEAPGWHLPPRMLPHENTTYNPFTYHCINDLIGT